MLNWARLINSFNWPKKKADKISQALNDEKNEPTQIDLSRWLWVRVPV